MNYQALASRVGNLIEKMGKPLTLRSYSAATYDPVTMTHTAGAATDVSVYGVEERYRSYEIDGTLIRGGDRKFIVASDTVPTLAMKMVESSVEYQIVAVNPLQPGTVTLYYEIHVRL